jgi:hypothetical protein
MNPYKHKIREPKNIANGSQNSTIPSLPKIADSHTVKTEPIETKQPNIEEPVNEDDWDDLPSVSFSNMVNIDVSKIGFDDDRKRVESRMEKEMKIYEKIQFMVFKFKYRPRISKSCCSPNVSFQNV